MANLIGDRYDFYECKQEENESLVDFLDKLQNKAAKCDFGDFLQDALRDRFVCGLASDEAREELLAVEDLTLARAVEIALEGDWGDSRRSPIAKAPPKHVALSRHYTVTDRRQYTYFKPPCLPELQKFKHSVCNHCNAKGHIARCCIKRNKHKNPIKLTKDEEKGSLSGVTASQGWGNHSGGQPPAINNKSTSLSEDISMNSALQRIQNPECSSKRKEQEESRQLGNEHPKPRDDSDENLTTTSIAAHVNFNSSMSTESPYSVNYAHKTSGRQPPYKIRLMLNKDIITFEIDTGSAITIVSESTYNRCFNHIPLKTTSAIVKTYSKESLSILGKISVNVYCNGQEYQKLRVFVLKGNGANLLGRSWLNVMKLNWNLIINNNSNDSGKLVLDTDRRRRPISELIHQARSSTLGLDAAVSAVRPASQYVGGADDGDEICLSPLPGEESASLFEDKPTPKEKFFESKSSVKTNFFSDKSDLKEKLYESRGAARDNFFNDKSDLKEKFAQVRTRTTAMESALKEEIQRLREKRVLPTPSGSAERQGHNVVVGHPL